MNQRVVRIALGLLILLAFLGHAAGIYQIGLISQLDSIIYDYRLRLTMPATIDDRIVILDIDERSLAVPQLGRWPWGRDQISALVEKLLDRYGVAMIGFDVVFAEPDESSGLPVLDALAKKELKDVPQYAAVLSNIRPQLDHDAVFAATIRGRPVVLSYYFNSDDEHESGALPEPVLPAGAFGARPIGFTSWRGYGGNLPSFQAAAVGAGHFNPLVDFDGVSRRVPMLVEYKGRYYESLSLAMVRLLIGLEEAGGRKSGTVTLPTVRPWYPPERFVSEEYSGLEAIDVGPLHIPVDETVSALIPYRGKRGSFPYISLADVYSDKVPADRLKGRIALIGTSAPGLLDLRSTPVGSVYPGVEIHANLVAGMLDQSIKQKPAYMTGAEVALLLAGGVALAVLLPFLSPLRASLASLFWLVLVAFVNIEVGWSWGGIVLPLASSVLVTAGLYAFNMSYGYFVESRSKRQFTELFGQYVPPELVDKMAEDPEKYSMEGKEENLTVLFSDVRGFTTISESLQAKELSAYINEYLTGMSMVIRGHGGTLDKYIGDAIMAFWGAPVEDAQHQRNAVITAMQMQVKAKELNEDFKRRGWPEFRIGIGVNSGVMRVGDMGSKLRKAYTVMGDPVNLGSRLEGITKQYGVGILIGEETRNAVKDVVFREVDRVRVKGKDEPVAIFEPIGLEGQLDGAVLDELKAWDQTMTRYRAQEWDQAEQQLRDLQRMNPHCSLYSKYIDKIAGHRLHPPGPGWDGVTKFETK